MNRELLSKVRKQREFGDLRETAASEQVMRNHVSVKEAGARAEVEGAQVCLGIAEGHIRCCRE